MLSQDYDRGKKGGEVVERFTNVRRVPPSGRERLRVAIRLSARLIRNVVFTQQQSLVTMVVIIAAVVITGTAANTMHVFGAVIARRALGELLGLVGVCFQISSKFTGTNRIRKSSLSAR